jgi:type I restriction enzyme, S subunit
MPGDVLYSREGGILGIACIIPLDVKLCLGQRMMLMRTGEFYISPLLMHWLNSPEILKQVRELTGGSASPHLNVKDIKNFPTPLPPLAEQQEIVHRVEALFQLADQLEARYQRAKAQVDKLPQAILAKAFRGELVPTEAELARQAGRSYESAAALLARIQTAHPQPATKPNRKTRTRL